MRDDDLLSNPRVWSYAAGGWLVIAGLTQLVLHVWGIQLGQGIVGQREFAINAMKQAFSLDPLQPSLWRTHRMMSVSLGLFFLFGGMVPILLAWARSPRPTLASIALFGTAFWTTAFALYAFLDPVVLPLVAAAGAVPLHGIVWLTATQLSDDGEEEAGSRASEAR